MPSKRSPKVAPGPAEIPAPFHAAYGPLLLGLPSSVVEKVKARAEVRGLDPATADDYLIIELLESAREAYERKKAGSRASAAKRRSTAKAKAALEAAPAALAVEPEAAPADAPADTTSPLP